MPDNRRYYVISDDNCKFESMTKEQILAAITQAVESHTISDVDTGFVTLLKENNRGTGLSLWFGTQAEYNAIETKMPDTIYFITDASRLDDMEAVITTLQNDYQSVVSSVDDVESDVNQLSYTVGTLQEAVGQIDADYNERCGNIEEDVSDLETSVTTIENTMSKFKTLLYSGSISVGDSLNVPLQADASDYALLTVDAVVMGFNARVTCSYNSGEITGTAKTIESVTNGTAIMNIYLKVSSDGETVIENNSELVIIQPYENEGVTYDYAELIKYGAPVTRITGVI